MTRKIFIVLIVASLIAATIPVSNAEAGGRNKGGIEPYKGIVGADSPFYGLKLFVQKLQISLEGNSTARLQMHLSLSRERLAEAYAAALTNNTGAVDAALTEFINNLKATNSTLDDGSLGDNTYINTSDDWQEQEDIIANMTNDSTVPDEISDMFSQTLVTAETIKNGRPFIWCNNTSTAYFVPPGQMKKISQGGTGKTPPGLGKKGYASPEPFIFSNNGTVVWPWDDGYDQLTLEAANQNGVAKNFTYASALGKHGKGNGKGNGNGKK